MSAGKKIRSKRRAKRGEVKKLRHFVNNVEKALDLMTDMRTPAMTGAFVVGMRRQIRELRGSE